MLCANKYDLRLWLWSCGEVVWHSRYNRHCYGNMRWHTLVVTRCVIKPPPIHLSSCLRHFSKPQLWAPCKVRLYDGIHAKRDTSSLGNKVVFESESCLSLMVTPNSLHCQANSATCYRIRLNFSFTQKCITYFVNKLNKSVCVSLTCLHARRCWGQGRPRPATAVCPSCFWSQSSWLRTFPSPGRF